MRFNYYLGAIGLVSGLALADPAPSVNLSVGAAITPGVCNVSLDNDGALDFSGYGYQDLSEDSATQLPGKGVRLDVSCGRSTTAVIDVTDNQPDSALTGDQDFSLGLQGEQSIGSYRVSAANILFDGRKGVIIRAKGSDVWEPTNFLYKGTAHAWAAQNNMQQPAAFNTANVTLDIKPTIVPRKLLDTTQPLTLQGSMSIALRYL